MERDEVWRTIDQQRAELADLMETFTDADWETPSLCEGWRVREVGAHLTLAQTGLLAGAGRDRPRARELQPDDPRHRRAAGRAAGRRSTRSLLRAMVGSRRKAPFVSDLEPLIDQLVHGQDMVVPLGRTREMPPRPRPRPRPARLGSGLAVPREEAAARLQPDRDGSPLVGR